MLAYAQKLKVPQQTTLARSTISNRAHIGKSRDADSILQLQRTIGNKAVQRLLQSREGDNERGAFDGRPSSLFRDFSRVPAHRFTAGMAPTEEIADQRPSVPAAEPVSKGSSVEPEKPLGEFNEEDAASGTTAVLTAEKPETAEAAQETKTATEAPQAAAATGTVIRGPEEIWYFDGEKPPNYTVSSPLSTNRTGGTFSWSVSPQLKLSSPTAATPTVTTVAASAAQRDAWIRVEHTDAAGVKTNASYRLTVLAPTGLTHLNDVDNADATYGYMSEIHYSISDQLGKVLPRDVPINEQFTGPVFPDYLGMDWRRGPEGSATVDPADWHDQVGGESAGHTPAPVAPGHADAGEAVCHWPGDWRVGSLTIGKGRRVSTVTWQKHRGFARHV